MARFTFGAGSGDLVTQAAASNSGVIKAAANLNATGTFWSAQSGGSQYTDLIDPNNAGVAITGVSTDANGRPKVFQGPDGVSEGWLDFGAGRFKVVATETTDTRVAAIVNSASSSTRSAIDGKYIKVAEAAYDPARSGAVGDGVTDDTSALASALSTVRAANGDLRLRPGSTYLTTGSLDPTGTRILGQGATIKAKSGGAGFNVLSATNGFYLENLTIDPNKAGRTDPGLGSGNGVRVSTGTGIAGLTIRNVKVLAGWRAGVQLDDGAGTFTDPINAQACSALLDNVTITGTNIGIYLLWLAGIKVQNCTITSTTSDGILDHMTAGTSIVGTSIKGAGRHSIITEYSRSFSAIGNYSKSPTSGGFVVGGGDASSYPASDFAITGNRSEDAGAHCYWVDTTLTTTPAGGVVPCYGTLTGNTARGAGQHGIYLNHAQWLTVTGNSVRGASSAGILTMSKNVALHGNVFTGNAYGAYFAAAAVGFGEYEWGRNINKGNTTQDWAFDANSVTGSSFDLSGSGVPTVAIPSGATGTYRRVDGGTSTSFYVREAGAWVAK